MNEFSLDDTIVAIATPPGRGGIGVVRLSGPAAVSIARTLTARAGLSEAPVKAPACQTSSATVPHATTGVQRAVRGEETAAWIAVSRTNVSSASMTAAVGAAIP